MEKKVVCSTIYNGACLHGLSLFIVSHTRLRWPLSLSPLVTNPAASRLPGERECGDLSLSHHWSFIQPHPVHREKGSAVASLSLSPLVTGPAASRPPGERECGGLSLSHRWSLIWPHPVCRGKGRKCIVSPSDGAEVARPDLRYTLFSLTKLRRGRAYTTYSQIPPAATHLVTS